jgi:hypothetical protein
VRGTSGNAAAGIGGYRQQGRSQSLLLVDSALRITALGDTVTIKALSDNGASLLPLLDAALPRALKMNVIQKCAFCISRR